MKNRRMLLPVLLSIALVFSLIVPILVLNTASVMAQGSVTPMVAACGSYPVGLKSDGTVVAPVDNVGGWIDIIQVAASDSHTVGLKSDGTVVAVGWNDYGQCDVGNWTDIVQVAAGSQTIGLRSDGTVVATEPAEDWDYGQCDVGGWTDIVQVTASGLHTVGLKSDGTVVAVGYNGYGECNVGGWTNILQVAAYIFYTVGLKSDGTVVAVGYNDNGRCDVGNWTDITYIAAGNHFTVGLKSDGTIIAVGSYYGESDVGGWNLGVTPYSLTISSTAGGSVTTPGEGTFTYDAGTVVDLVAESEEGYQFVRWTGDVDKIGNVNAAATNITMRGNYSITANFAIPPVQYNLTIASAAEGSVTVPGEGTFSYDDGTVVNLAAEAEEGYRFVNWTGDVDTIGNVTAALTTITMDGDYSVTANFVGVVAGNVGVKAGDWIKVEYKITGWPAGQPYPEWLKVEFLSVEGTSANTRATLHMSDGTEQSDTVPADLAAGGGEAFGLSGFVVSANLTTGDSVYITGYGDVAIEGETTRTYAGARRTVVYASISQYGAQLTYYWDKLTGVVVEASTTYAGITATAKATETNMWEATTVGMPWWVWVIVAVAIVAVAFTVYRLKKKKTPTPPIPPAEGT